MNYTHQNGSFDKTETRYNGIKLSGATIAHRNQLRHSIDDFTGFRWRGVDAFENFGAFIINNKNTLKFYNGSTWKNEYTKPQFENSSTLLTGLSFDVQKIDFTIGVYWINEEDYRQLIYWLNPYEINTLEFDFEPDYYYQVKLSSVESGTRYIIGKENNEYQYYAEMKLSFEVQGPNCAYRKIPYAFKYELSSLEDKIIIKPNTLIQDNKLSDLDFPFYLNMPINLSNWSEVFEDTDTDCSITLKAKIKYGTLSSIELFSVTFNNLTDGESEGTNLLEVRYNSESGLLFLNHGDSTYFLLNQLTTASNGKKIVDAIESIRHTIAGKFEDPSFNLNKYQIEIECIANASNWENTKNAIELLKDDDTLLTTMSARARTNLI